VNSVKFFSNGKYIASGGADNTIVVTRIFDPTPSSCLGAASPTVIPPLEFTSLVSS
jgi:WD40 repeat protein